MRGQINIFEHIARIINRGNSIVVDRKGVEDNVEPSVMAAWYLGIEDRKDKRQYQKRITAPWLVDPLLEFSHGMRMQIYMMRSAAGCYLVCVLGEGGYSGMGYCRLDEFGLTHNQAKALEYISRAADEAYQNYILAFGIMENGKKLPVTVDIPRDPLLVAA